MGDLFDPVAPAVPGSPHDAVGSEDRLVFAYLSRMFAECDPPLTLPQAITLEQLAPSAHYPLWTKLCAGEQAEMEQLHRALAAIDVEAARAALTARRRAGTAVDERPTDAELVAWHNARGLPRLDVAALTPAVAEQLWTALAEEGRARAEADATAAVVAIRARQNPIYARQAELAGKAEASPAERAMLRQQLGLTDVPSLTEWLTSTGVPAGVAAAATAHFIVLGGQHLAEERIPADEVISLTAAALLLPITAGGDAQQSDLARLEQRLAAAERRASEAELRVEVLEEEVSNARRLIPRTPTLRQGLAAVRVMLRTDVHVTDTGKRNRSTRTEAEREVHALFKYQPLGWAERLVVHGLATIAGDQGLLESHPWALVARPVAGHDAPRVRMPYPGISELARVIGYEPDAAGRVERAARSTLEGALIRLCRVPRFIAMPIWTPPAKKGGEWTEDIEVQQTLWVEAAHTMIAKGVVLRLHPAAIASHIASFVEMPDLAARYERARIALGKRQMRDEWAIGDDYFRSRARVALGVLGGGLAKEAKTIGRDPREYVRAERKRLQEVAAAEGLTVGDQTISARASQETMLRTLDLLAWAKKNGARPAIERVRETFAFGEVMGSVLSVELVGDIWHFNLPHPDAHKAEGRLVAATGETTDPRT